MRTPFNPKPEPKSSATPSEASAQTRTGYETPSARQAVGQSLVTVIGSFVVG